MNSPASTSDTEYEIVQVKCDICDGHCTNGYDEYYPCGACDAKGYVYVKRKRASQPGGERASQSGYHR